MEQRLNIDEYQADILYHLSSIQSTTSPNLSLIQQQPEINLKMRPLLLDFLMDVISKLNLSLSTFPLTVNLIDRYCSTRIVKKQHYQLLGLTSLWISCKNLDAKFKIPSLFDLCKMCCNCYDKKLFLEMENHVLKSLNWLISNPTFDQFIEIYINMLDSTKFIESSPANKNNVKTMAVYICELIQFYPNIYFNNNSSQIALGGLLTSLLICKVPIKLESALKHLNSYLDQDSIFDLASFNSFYKNLLKILKCPPPSLKLKYFSETGPSLKLMKIMIHYVNDRNANITPITPKFQIHEQSSQSSCYANFPRTPVSNNISPRIQLPPHSPAQVPTNTHSYNHSISSTTSELLPSPKASPENLSFDSFPARSPVDIHPPLHMPTITTTANFFHGRKRSIDDDTSVESPNKKLRARKPAFYIS